MLNWLLENHIIAFVVLLALAYAAAADETGRAFRWATLKYIGILFGVILGVTCLAIILSTIGWYDLVDNHSIIAVAITGALAVPCAWYFAAKNTGRPFTWTTLEYIGLSLGLILAISIMEWLQ